MSRAVPFTQERKDAWIAALMNPEIKQGRGRLRSADGFCCLGVYCDINKDDLGYWMKDETGANGEGFIFMSDTEDQWGETRPDFAEDTLPVLLSIDGYANPRFDISSYIKSDAPQYEDSVFNLADLNDSGFTFPQIADLIRFFIPVETFE